MESSESTPGASTAPQGAAAHDVDASASPSALSSPEASSTDAATPDGAAIAPAELAPSDDEDPADEIISPGLERLPPPRGAARFVPVAYPGKPPSFVFLTTVSVLSLASDIATKLWAEHNLDGYPGVVTVWENHVAFVLAKNRGGAWGLLQSTNENVRRPFFLLVSAAAIAFIVTLYRRLQATQRALKWGLPLVLGGALGNVFDRIRYGHVIDFIDIHMKWKDQDHHWPTFNVADIAICVGVGLMAIDMFTSKRPRRASESLAPGASILAGEASSGAAGEGAATEGSGGAATAASSEGAPVDLPPVAAEPSPAPETDVPPTREEAGDAPSPAPAPAPSATAEK